MSFSLTARFAHGLMHSIFACVTVTLADSATAGEPIQPIPRPARQDPAKVELGRRLFGDPRLSANASVSCASCHELNKGGADARPRSPGLHGELTDVNTPTVLNAALNFKQFWDGRADSLEAQIDQVIQNPKEMGARWDTVLSRVKADAAYASAFAASYKDGVSKANIENAIASYERTLLTPDSRFDRFLRGQSDAISVSEKEGYSAFKRYGCVACHQGVNVGGNMFQKLGVIGDYFERRGNPTPADLGRFLVTGNESDKYVFKVPSLRNVALTAPYFHDGSVATLEEAVAIMFRVQVGRAASKGDQALIVNFLRTMNGELPADP